MKKILEHEIRKNVYELLSKHPGLHLSKIAEMLNIRSSLAEYHLAYMEKNNVIFSVKGEGEYYRRYYLADSKLGIRDKKILSVLRQENFLYIITLFLKKPRVRHRDILKELDVTSSTLSYYLTRLVKYGIIEASFSSEGEPGYTLIDRKRIIYLLFKYQLYRMLDDFKDIWDELEY